MPPQALLGDVNTDLVDTFESIRDHPRAVYNAIHRIPLGRRSYNRARKQDTSGLPAVERAARFVFLNRFCFNGLYRTNQLGQFNVPFSASRNGHLPTSEELLQASRILRNAIVVSSDFEDTLARTRAGDFVYLDPPYALSNRRMFRQYGPDSFGIADLERLQVCLQSLNARGVHFVVSYAMCKEALRTFHGWKVSKVHTHRNISGFARHRRRAVELLISNCSPEASEGGNL